MCVVLRVCLLSLYAKSDDKQTKANEALPLVLPLLAALRNPQAVLFHAHPSDRTGFSLNIRGAESLSGGGEEGATCRGQLLVQSIGCCM